MTVREQIRRMTTAQLKTTLISRKAELRYVKNYMAECCLKTRIKKIEEELAEREDTEMAEDKVTQVKTGEYKGYPVITLPNGSRHGFTFGMRKAEAIMKHVEEIKQFVEAHAQSENKGK